MTNKLLIEAEARFASVLDGFDQMSKSASKSVREIERSMTFLKTAVGAVFAEFSVSAISSEIQRLIGDMSALDDVADRTGESVENVSELFNRWKVGGNSFGELTGALDKLIKSMQGADEESSGAAQAFKNLGIETTDAGGNLRNASQVFDEVAQALNRYGDSTTKTTYAIALFGKSGGDLIPKLKDLAEETESLGKITADQVKQADELEKAWRRMSIEADLLKSSLLSGLIPTFTNFIEQLRAGTKAAGGFWAALFRYGTSGTDPTKELERIRTREAELRKQLENEQPALGFFGRGARNRGQVNKEAIDAELAQLSRDREYFMTLFNQQAGTKFDDPALPGMGKPSLPPLPGRRKDGGRERAERVSTPDDYDLKITKEIAKVLEGSAIVKGKEFADVLARLDNWYGRGLISVQLYDSALDELFKDYDAKAAKAAEETKRQADETQRLADAWRDTLDPTRKYQRQIEEINALEGKDGGLDGSEAVRARGKVLSDMDRELNAAKTVAKETDDIAQQLGMTFSSAAEDAILKWQGFRGLLQGIIADAGRIVLRKSFTEPAANAFAGWLKGSSGGSGGGWVSGSDLDGSQGTGGIWGWISQFLAGKRAMGGPVSAGSAYLVGEQGPEIFVPKAGGTILPNGATGSVVVHQQIHVDSRSDSAVIAQAMKTAERNAVAAVLQNMRSRGSMARA